MFLFFPIQYFRGYCARGSSMCPKLQTGDWAPGHRVFCCVFPDLGWNNGTLWRTDVGWDVSNQTLLQQQLVLDKMVRNVDCT